MHGIVVCDGQADTYTCVRTLQLQDLPNRLPIDSSTPTPASGTPTPTPNGVPARVRTGTPSFDRSFAFVPPFRSSSRSFSSPPHLVSFSLSFVLSLSLSLSFSLYLPIYLLLPTATSALTSLRQTQAYARTSNRAYCRGYPSTRRCFFQWTARKYPDWDFLEAIFSPFNSQRGQTIDYRYFGFSYDISTYKNLIENLKIFINAIITNL